MPQPDFPFWAVIARISIKQLGSRLHRLVLELPTGDAVRARRFKTLLNTGRIKEGTLAIEGRALPGAMRRLGFPSSVIDAAGRFAETIGRPGQPVSEEKRVLRHQAIEAVAQAMRAEVRNLFNKD